MRPSGARAFFSKTSAKEFRLFRLPISPPSSVTMHTTPESESDVEAEPLHEADAGGQNGHSTDGIMRKTLPQLPVGHCHHFHGHLQTMQPDPPREGGDMQGQIL
ncbi:TPA: hypothetical protein ACH3X1_008110 [Trebouxia sp. C0004]